MIDRIPQPIRFALAGGIGNVAFFYLDQAVYAANPFSWQRSTVSWALSYLISVWLQHFLNTILVFGRNKNGYWSSLAKTYMTYTISIVLSPIVNMGLINYLNFGHQMAWFGTLASTGMLNYFTVSAAMKSTDDKEK